MGRKLTPGYLPGFACFFFMAAAALLLCCSEVVSTRVRLSAQASNLPYETSSSSSSSSSSNSARRLSSNTSKKLPVGSKREISKSSSTGTSPAAAESWVQTQQCNVPNKEPCPKSNPGVKCRKDPCQNQTCKGYPAATCYPFICRTQVSYGAQMIGGPCTPVFIDNNCQVVNCKP